MNHQGVEDAITRMLMPVEMAIEHRRMDQLKQTEQARPLVHKQDGNGSALRPFDGLKFYMQSLV